MSTRSELFKRVSELIAEQVEVSGPISEATHFVQDLEFDSLDVVEFVMAVEEEFDIDIPDEDAEELKSVGLVLDRLEQVQTAA